MDTASPEGLTWKLMPHPGFCFSGGLCASSWDPRVGCGLRRLEPLPCPLNKRKGTRISPESSEFIQPPERGSSQRGDPAPPPSEMAFAPRPDLGVQETAFLARPAGLSHGTARICQVADGRGGPGGERGAARRGAGPARACPSPWAPKPAPSRGDGPGAGGRAGRGSVSGGGLCLRLGPHPPGPQRCLEPGCCERVSCAPCWAERKS